MISAGGRAASLDEDDVRDAVGLGLTIDDVTRWTPFRPLEIYWAKKHGLPLRQARRWADAGVPVRDTVHALAVGLTLAEVHEWQRLGFLPADAWEAKETGVGIAETVAWRDVGFVAPAAFQLIRDGWTLAAATIARYEGIDRYGPSPLPTRRGGPGLSPARRGSTRAVAGGGGAGGGAVPHSRALPARVNRDRSA